MAEEPEEDGGQPAPDQGGPGRYFVLVLLVLLMEGAVGYWAIDQAVPAPEEPAEEVTEEEEQKPWVAPIYYENLEDIVVEPTAFRGNRMVQLSLALEVDAQAVVDELEVRQDQVWDLILRRLERLAEADFRDPQKKKLKSDLIKALNDGLQNPGVTNVFITQLIMQ
jgi:flagellar basal body-associated protein FliL